MALGQLLLIILSVFVTGTPCECSFRQAYFKKIQGGQDCQTTPKGQPWSSPSPEACLVQCMTRLEDSCQSAVYNAAAQTCTPGSSAFGVLQKAPFSANILTSSDTLFYISDPVPTCNAALGFSPYDVCGTYACLYLSDFEATFDDAKTYCEETKNSRMIVTDTLQKFALFWHVSINEINLNTLVGLSDTANEGSFVWVNGEPLSSDQSYIWLGGQPNDYNNQDCVEAEHKTYPGYTGLNDLYCHLPRYFICEQVLTEK